MFQSFKVHGNKSKLQRRLKKKVLGQQSPQVTPSVGQSNNYSRKKKRTEKCFRAARSCCKPGRAKEAQKTQKMHVFTFWQHHRIQSESWVTTSEKMAAPVPKNCLKGNWWWRGQEGGSENGPLHKGRGKNAHREGGYFILKGKKRLLM